MPSEIDLRNPFLSLTSGVVVFKGYYDADTNTPMLEGSSTVTKGDLYVVSVAGVFYGQSLEVGDILIAATNNASSLSDWVLIQGNIPTTVTSVFGRTGAVVAMTGDYNTSQVTELTNLYFTEARVRSTLLTGLVAGVNTPITATDNLLTALQNIQAQIDAVEGSDVDSVSGTTNRITVSPTTGNVIVDISANYVGQTSIETVGSINVGTWKADIIDVPYGGTGIGAYSIGSILYSNTGSSLDQLLDVAVGSVLVSGGIGIAPIYSSSPTISTSVTTPLLIGGTTSTSTLTYKTTTGVGATGADHIFQVGNNGATEALRILNNATISLPLTTGNQLRFTTSGSAFGRVLTLPSISNWIATSVNASFSGGWNLDDTTKSGWFYKLDTRGIGVGTDEIAFFRIPTGGNPHGDEYPLLRILSSDQISVGKTAVAFSPTSTLEVTSRGTTTGGAFQVNNSLAVSQFQILDNGNITAGIISIDQPNARFRVGTATTADANADSLFATSDTTKKGLVLQMKASQTADAFQVQNSIGTVLTAISATTGGISIGITPSDQWLIGATYNFTSGDNTTKYSYINISSISNTTGFLGVLYGSYIEATNSVGASVIGALTGNAIKVNLNSASNWFSTLFVGQEITMTTGSGQTGTVTDAIYLRLNAPTYTGSKPTSSYGLLIGNLGVSGMTNNHVINIATQSGATNNYAFVSGSGNLHGFGTTTPVEAVDISGNMQLKTAGNGIKIKEGTNATMGVATLVAGTVTVNTTKVTANSRIYLTVNGGTLTNVGSTYISARTAGTSFTISSTNVLDSSSVAWLILEPAP